jgi:hypothetical protein
MPGVMGGDSVDPAKAESASHATEQIADGQELEDLLADDDSSDAPKTDDSAKSTDDAASNDAETSKSGSASGGGSKSTGPAKNDGAGAEGSGPAKASDESAESSKSTPASKNAAESNADSVADEKDTAGEDLPNGATDEDTISINAQVSGSKDNSKTSRSRNSLR